MTQGWHYKRQVLAQSYIKTLFTGVMLSTTVQAQPGTGLSSFLLHDIAQEAQSSGYVVGYIDLSQPQVPVSAACIAGVQRLLKNESLGRQSWRFLKNIFHSSASAEGREWQPDGPSLLGDGYYLEHIERHGSLFEELLSQLVSGDERLLLIVDHAHEFARNEVAVRMALALRNVINKHRNNVWPLYGSANMQRWRSVFQEPGAPLYSEGASVHGLPALGKPFVRQLCVHMEVSGFEVDNALRCFVRVGYRPQLLKQVLHHWHQDPRTSLDEHCQHVLQHAAQGVVSPHNS